MSVQYILKQVGAKLGLSTSASGSRAVLLRYLNEAADELYSQCDITGSVMEQVFKVNGDQTVALPMYVGPIRAARDANNRVPWHINQLRPRYNELNWQDGWYNYRLKNTQPLVRSISNQSVLTYGIASLDAIPVTVSVSGPTATANLATETIVMDALTKSGTTDFLDITAVTKSDITLSDVTVSDADGNTLTVIPNNMKEAKYQILDVSGAPWAGTSGSSLDNYIELLYKKALPYLSLDTDEFPAAGYDNQIVNKCLQLYYEEQGKADIASAYDQKATRGLARKKQEQNLATEDCVSFTSNPHDNLQPRIRGRRFTRWYGRRVR
jgi:hypothetical protein